MCLILVAREVHPDYPLVVAANRDEYYHRPTAAAAFWPDCDQVLAGRDLECMGTWLGVTRSGRFAALTNFRDPAERKTNAPSRGNLVSDFLAGDLGSRDYIDRIREQAPRYNGFNLLLGDATGLFCFSSRDSSVQELPSGIHGLSNHLLNTPWPKVQRGKMRLRQALTNAPNIEVLLELLGDGAPASDDELPDTGVGRDRERMLSPARIVSPEYGTRASTVVLFGRDRNVSFTERTILRGGISGPTRNVNFRLAEQ